MKKATAPSKKITPRLTAVALLGAWFACLLVESLFSTAPITSPNFVHDMSYVWFTGGWLALFGILLTYGSISPAVVKWFSLIASWAYCLRASYLGRSYFLSLALCGVAALMLWLCGVSFPTVKKTLSAKAAAILLAVLAVMGGGCLAMLSISAYNAYLTPSTGSTGLYTQLLWRMSHALGQTATLEFGEVASHFSAHISPIFYLYLPFYALCPSAVTLMVLQATAVASAVVPLYLLGRNHGLSRGLSVWLGGIALLLPAVMGGASGGLHELALLFPLLLWLLWAMEQRRTLLVGLFAFLCLCVRETAALYIMTVGLYWLLRHGGKANADDIDRKKCRRMGLIVAAGAAVYLIVALAVLTYVGRGTLITRYENVTGVYNTSFWTLCWELIMNPAVAVYEMLTVNKLHFVAALLLPVAFLPLWTKKKAFLVFLIPLVLINLLPDVAYQHDVTFPYGMGMAALVLYAAVEGLATRRDGRPTTHRRTVTLTVCFTLTLAAMLWGAQHADTLAYAAVATEETSQLDTLMDAVPGDVSVSASGHLIPHLAGRAEIYRLDSEILTDYVVLDLREAHWVKGEDIYYVAYYEEQGYRIIAQKEGVGAVLSRK